VPEPYRSIQLDTTLRLYGNGKIPSSLLVKAHSGRSGYECLLYGPAAFWWNVMWSEAEKAGIELVASSRGYRSYGAQETMFLERYSRVPTARVPRVTRKWKGHTYFLRRGKSPSATPGFSPHGWGLAMDVSVPAKTFKWLCENGPRFGFYLQGPSILPNGKKNPEFEAWHWQFCHLDPKA